MLRLVHPSPSTEQIALAPSNKHSAFRYFFQRITHHGHSLLVADVIDVTHTPP
jgi:hypothetical protein